MEIIARVVIDKVGELGIQLTDEQSTQLVSDLLSSPDGTASHRLEIGDEQLVGASPETLQHVKRGLPLRISLEEVDVDQHIEALSRSVEEGFPGLIDELSAVFLDAVVSGFPKQQRRIRRQERAFQRRLQGIWQKPLDLLELHIEVAVDVGTAFNRGYRESAAAQSDLVFEALTRLHARGCQIAKEVLVLLRNGYADGAHARWRSLHEVAVVGLFISGRGIDVAERYLLHDVVESYKAATLHQAHCAALGYEPLSEAEFMDLKARYDSLIERYGREYRIDYGWAQAALGVRRPSFSDLEQAAGLERWRPYYKLASYNVHASSKGVLYRLGLDLQDEGILLAGPSNTGFVDPGHGTAISLHQLTCGLLLTRPNVDSLIYLFLLDKLMNRIGHEFARTQCGLEEQAKHANDPAT